MTSTPVKHMIRKWLGITDVQASVDMTHLRLRSVEQEIFNLSKQVGSITPGIARVVGRLDPMYAKSEFDPERIAESKRIGEEVEARLRGEDWARKHTEGKV